MTSTDAGNSPGRPQAPGFPVAPLIEAVIDTQFEPALADEELKKARSALEKFYPTFRTGARHEFTIDTSQSVQVGSKPTYKGEANDASEISLLRPEGLASSQLAPYRDWTALYSRFRRDLLAVFAEVGQRKISRIGVRSINRIDVPPGADELVRYEDYLTAYPHIPEQLDPLLDFHLVVTKPEPEIDALARIIVRTAPKAVEDKGSFFLDIDLYRTSELPSDLQELDALFSQFRTVKNRLYRACLSERALKEFEQ